MRSSLQPAPPAPPAAPASPPGVPQPAAAPAAAGSPAQTLPVAAGVQVPLAGVPRTRQEMEVLRARRSELSDQLQSATSRRNSLASRLRGADGADRAGLEQHLQLLDRRILQLESDIAVTGQQLAASPRFTGSQPPDGRGGSGPIAGPIGAMFILCVLMPLAITFARNMWRRGSRPTYPRESAETVQRLARLETAVDSIAIEMERVSEGQRFVTRLLSESHIAPRFEAVGEAATRELSPVAPATDSE